MLSVYKDKTAIVLGGAGFIGYHLVGRLLKEGARVIVVDDMSRGRSVNKHARHLWAEVNHMESMLSIFESYSPEYVFNLTAVVAGVLHNQGHHIQMYMDNTAVLFPPVIAAAQAGVPNYLQTSSVCIYSPENQNPCKEESGFDGVPHPANAGYAEAKRDGERAVMWSDLKRAVIVRPSNVVGWGDYYDDKAHVLPALIRRAFEEEGDELQLYGPPDTVREFIDAIDVATGMMTALAYGEDRQAYNIGVNGKGALTIRQLAEKVLSISHIEKKITSDESIGGGDPKRWSDASKLNALGWEPVVQLDDSIDQAINFYIHRGTDGTE